MSDAPADIRPTTACDLLSAGRRLAAVVAVEEAQGPVSVGELAAMTAAAEHGRPPGRLGGRTGDAVRAELEGTHLPELVEHDVLRADGDGYAAGANMPGVLAVADAATENCRAPETVLGTRERQPGDDSGGVTDERAAADE